MILSSKDQARRKGKEVMGVGEEMGDKDPPTPVFSASAVEYLTELDMSLFGLEGDDVDRSSMEKHSILKINNSIVFVDEANAKPVEYRLAVMQYSIHIVFVSMVILLLVHTHPMKEKGLSQVKLPILSLAPPPPPSTGYRLASRSLLGRHGWSLLPRK